MSVGVPNGWFERTRTKAGMQALLDERSRTAAPARRQGRRQRVVITAVFVTLIVAGIVANVYVS